MYVVARFLVLAGPEPFLPWSNPLLIVGGLSLVLSICGDACHGQAGVTARRELDRSRRSHRGSGCRRHVSGPGRGSADRLQRQHRHGSDRGGGTVALSDTPPESARHFGPCRAATVLIGIAALAGVLLPLSAASRSFLFFATEREAWATPFQALIVLFGITIIVTFGRWMQRLFVNPPLTSVGRSEALLGQGNLVWLLVAGGIVMAVLQWQFPVLVWPAVRAISRATMAEQAMFSWTTHLAPITLSTGLVGRRRCACRHALTAHASAGSAAVVSMTRTIGGAADPPARAA